MIEMRKAWWAVAVSAALAGCTGDQATTTSGIESGGTTAPGTPAPETPPPGPGSSKNQDAQPKELSTPVTPETPRGEASKEQPQAPPLDAPTVTPITPKEGADAKKDQASARSPFTPEEMAEIDKLPPADKALALKQVICPISGKHLGFMGTPAKTTAEGKTVLLCCDGCEEAVKEDPKKALARINQK